MKNLKESTKTIFKMNTWIYKVKRYKFNIQKSIIFLFMNNEHVDIKINIYRY